ncbi:hypothetical protein [Azospirillum argentinense]
MTPQDVLDTPDAFVTLGEEEGHGSAIFELRVRSHQEITSLVVVAEDFSGRCTNAIKACPGVRG